MVIGSIRNYFKAIIYEKNYIWIRKIISVEESRLVVLYKNFQPVVSIILPTFNRRELLERAVKSVIVQTFGNWELIVVDDGSTDGSFEMLSTYINEFPNIRYMKHSNRKLPITLNTGIMASCGDFITFLGSDDEYKPEHLSLRVAEFEKDSSIDFIHGGIEVIGNPYVKDKNDFSRQIHLSECAVGGTFFIKRKVLLELDGFKDISYSEDSELFERAKGKYKIKKVTYPTYIYYRDTPDSICNTIE